MKRSNTVVTACLAFLCAQAGFARDFQHGVSYMGSEYQTRKDPVLPYETCEITHTPEGSAYKKLWNYNSSAYVEFDRPSIGFGLPITGDMERLHADYYLTCWVGVSTYAFSIPIQLDDFDFKGLSMEFMGNTMKINLQNLDGKTLAEVAGEYSGPLGALGVLIAGRQSGYLTNQFEAEIRIKGWYAGLAGIKGGYQRLNLQLGDNVTNLVDRTKGDKPQSLPDIMKYKFLKVNWNRKLKKEIAKYNPELASEENSNSNEIEKPHHDTVPVNTAPVNSSPSPEPTATPEHRSGNAVNTAPVHPSNEPTTTATSTTAPTTTATSTTPTSPTLPTSPTVEEEKKPQTEAIVSSNPSNGVASEEHH